MGQVDLSMIVHVCGINDQNPIDNTEQFNLINGLFTEKNKEENTTDYAVQSSKNQNGMLIFISNKETFPR